MPGIDEQKLWDDYERLKAGPNGAAYQKISPREAVSLALEDPAVPQAEKDALRARHQEWWFQSALKGAGRGLGLDSAMDMAKYDPFGGGLAHLMAKKVAPKLIGREMQTPHEYIGDLMERSPIQSGWNNAAGMAGTIGGMLVPYSKAGKLAAATKAVPGVLAEAPTLGRAGLAALRAALTGGASASMNVQDQGDAIKYGEQTGINPMPAIVAGTTSAAGSAANSILGPVIDKRWLEPAGELLHKARTAVATPTEGAIAAFKGLASGAKGILANALLNGGEEVIQSQGEQWNQPQYATREGMAANERRPSTGERFLWGTAFGSAGELASPLLRAIKAGRSGGLQLPVSPDVADLLKDIADVPGSIPNAGPIDKAAAARLANTRALTGTPAAINQKLAPGANVQPADTTKTFAERNTPQKVRSISNIVAHQTAEDIRRTAAVARQWLEKTRPDPKAYWRDLEDGTEIPVWPVNGRWFGEASDGTVLDVTNVNPQSYEVMRFRRAHKTLPGGSQGPAILHDANQRVLPEDGQIIIDKDGVPHLVVTRGRRDFSTKDRPYGMMPLDFSLGPSGMHPTEPNRLVTGFLPQEAKAERQKIKESVRNARAAMKSKKTEAVVPRLMQAPKVLPIEEVQQKVAPELKAINEILGVPAGATPSAAAQAGYPKGGAPTGTQSIEDQAAEWASLMGVSYEEALAMLMRNRTP